MAEKATDKVEVAEKAKGVQVSCVVSAEELERIEDFRWTNRIDKRSDVVRLALTEFFANH